MQKKNALLLSATTLLSIVGVSAIATNADAATVTVKANDTVWDFSQEYGVTVDQIKTANQLTGENPIILIGQKLDIPTDDSTTTQSQAATPDWNAQLAAQSAATASANAALQAATTSANAASAQAASAAAQSAATASANAAAQAATASANAASAQAASAAAQSTATASANAASAAAQSAATASANAALIASTQAASQAAQSAAVASNQAASQAAAQSAAAASQATQASQATTQTAASTTASASSNYTFTYYNATPEQGWGDASTTADGTSTASGRDADGYLIAAADSSIAFGTHIQTPYGEAVVHDRGGAITGNHIDVLQ